MICRTKEVIIIVVYQELRLNVHGVTGLKFGYYH